MSIDLRQLKQILIAIDQVANTLVPPWKGPHRGWADETLSSRSWRRSGHSTAWRISQRCIDWFFLVFFRERSHCFESYVSERIRAHMPPELREDASLVSENKV
jgi:hypothetical protein